MKTFNAWSSPRTRRPRLRIAGRTRLCDGPSRPRPGRRPGGVLPVVGVENEYADVVAQIGGRYVQAAAIETDPNTDPHTFEVSPKIAAQIAGAALIVKNGIGYDSWADKIIAAAPNATRKVIDVSTCWACRTTRRTLICGMIRKRCRQWQRPWRPAWPRCSPRMPIISRPM